MFVMRIDVSLGALAPYGLCSARVHDRRRWSLGSHAAEVRRVGVAFRLTGDSDRCRER
jgi:hypothetical protein